MGPQEGLFVESLMAAISQGSDRAKELLEEFLAGRAAKVVAQEKRDGDAVMESVMETP